eukprot:2989008-Amphidinium_carterae.1
MDTSGKLHIFDWKRSVRLPTKHTNPFGEKMKVVQSRRPACGPLSAYDDCAVVHYRLQLNLYKYILEANYGVK